LINKNILVNWFINFDQELYFRMENTKHSPINEELQKQYIPMPFHIEGSVWTHTMMVVTYIDTIFNYSKKSISFKDYIILLTTALLHDIGKPAALKVKTSEKRPYPYNSFGGHEGISSFLALKHLKQLQKDFPKFYNEEISKTIFSLISTHGVAIEEDDDNLNNLKTIFRAADKNGAIRNVDEEIYNTYPNRKFSKRKDDNSCKKIILITGLPASGKSYFIDNNFDSNEWFILSKDKELFYYYFNFINEIDNPTYREVFLAIHENEQHFKSFCSIFNAKLLETSKTYNKVIIDMTLLSLKSRRKILNIFDSFKASSIILATDIETIFERNSRRKEIDLKIVPDSVILDKMTQFTIPVKKEGFDNIEIILN